VKSINILLVGPYKADELRVGQYLSPPPGILRKHGWKGVVPHPLSRYNEVIHYLKGPKYHGGLV
jgi:hypothetical protein